MRLIDADKFEAYSADGTAFEGEEFLAYLSGMQRVLEDIDAAPTIDPGSTASRWIPVEERLPEANKSVLVSYVPFTADETERAGLYVSIAFLGYQSPCGRWYWGEYEGEELTDFVEVINEITHWMPLPEPPEVIE